ncbi:MAG: tripartite tricarboxylate transporter TctB family protein [Pseudomonadota bacterium]|nr:tripartite tricarboxylate transporter TctB family protein [Pseudomonadota bacterium]
MRSPLGADLVIPALALGFAAYFFISIADLAWEAKANGVVIGGVLVLLIAVQLARTGLQLRRGEGDLSLRPLWEPREAASKRIGMVIITVLFIATLKWLGLTLGLLLALLASLWLMGVRKPVPLVVVPVGVAAAAYLLFIALLQSDIPHGPLEALLP